MMKVKNLISSFWVAILPFLSQVTVNSSWISFSASDVSSVEWSIWSWVQTVFNMILDFKEVIIWVLVVFIVLRFVFNRIW